MSKPALRPPMTRATRIRYVFYAVGVTIAVLVALDGVLGWLGRRGVIALTAPNDVAWVANRMPWAPGADGNYHADPTVPVPMHDSPFRIEKGDAYRVFLIGESFLAGVGAERVEPASPEVHFAGIGTIANWLENELRRRFPTVPIEVVNASLEAQVSDRMVETMGFVLQHAPDLIVVATCNNEGGEVPTTLEKGIHDLATFRALRTAFGTTTDRPVHTTQAADATGPREHFRQNLRLMTAAAAAQNVPLLLATLPVNVRYEGDAAGLLLPGGVPRRGAVFGAYPACVLDGKRAYDERRFDDAYALLEPCPDAEAQRWLGLTELARGHEDAGRAALEASVELVPRNRCRPSFQEVIRSEAAGGKTTRLVDLDRWVRARAPGGLPGPELFVDYCHMNWQGQGLAADAIVATMLEQGLHPKATPMDVPVVDRATAFRLAPPQ